VVAVKRRCRQLAEVWVHSNAGWRMSAHATAEGARHAAETYAAGWTSPAAMIPGKFEWRVEGDGVERLYMPHPVEPEPRRTDHTVWHLRVNP
jgi:hypothetical protein